MTPNPNDLPSRQAMGLPAGYVDRWQEFGPTRAARLGLTGRTARCALDALDDLTAPVALRWAAGAVLALLGDPRILRDDPRMVDVPGGRARLGTDPHEVPEVVGEWGSVGVLDEWVRKECPVHDVDLAPYRIARYPVTNLEYRCFLQATGSAAVPTSWPFGTYPPALANHPVWGLHESAVDAYVQWLGSTTGRPFRLPSEAEWEFAASGGDRREYPWGQTFDPHRANTVEAGPLTTTPVGAYPDGRSPFGVDDMAGNVEELVADVYAPYPGGTHVADDLWRSRGTYRVARGGSFTRYGDLARCRRRHGWYDKDIYVVGFRIVEDVT